MQAKPLPTSLRQTRSIRSIPSSMISITRGIRPRAISTSTSTSTFGHAPERQHQHQHLYQYRRLYLDGPGDYSKNHLHIGVGRGRGVHTSSEGSSSEEGSGSGSGWTKMIVGGSSILALALASTISPIALDEASPRSRSHADVTSPPSSALQKQPSGQKMISAEEVMKHRGREDCWVIIEGNVYDVTDFLDMHPGGAGVILNKAGMDATSTYAPLHPPGTLEEHLPPTALIGPVDPSTLHFLPAAAEDPDEARIKKAREEMPPIEAILNLQDMEDLAEKVMSRQGWAYYRSAADAEDSYRNNEESWKRYYFRPRVLRDARERDPSSTMLGHYVSLPVYIAPAAMAKLGHPLGEVNLTRGAGECGIVQGISSNASCSLEEMVEARKDGQSLIFQLYLNRDRPASERLLKKVEDLGCTGIMFTVDAAAASKRTLDQRTKAVLDTPPASASEPGQDGKREKKAGGVAQAISGYQDENLLWEDINFIRKHTKLPILVKGIQCLEDAEIAAEYGVEGIILSNHGARQLNFAPASIDVLYEIRQRRPELFDKMEIYVDGGVKSGTDVVKALALGAKGVGLGRSFLYANACYGEEGVQKIYEILHWEVCAAMAMLGAHKLSDLKPEMVERGWWFGQGPR